MADTHQTLNTEMAPASSEPAPSSGADKEPLTDAQGSNTSADSLKSDGASDQSPAATQDKGQDDSSTDDTRFDKHPRWQQRTKELQERDYRIISLEAELKAVKEISLRASDPPKQAKDEKSSRDYEGEIAKLDDLLDQGEISIAEFNKQQREILRAQSKEETEKIRQEAANTVQTVLQRKSAEERQQKFLADNPDYLKHLKSGELEAIKKSDPYGIHDDVSAYYAKQLEDAKAETKDAVEKAIKETEDRVLKNLKIKKEALTLGQGPGSAPPDSSETAPELKNPKKFGGITTVLANRLAARRQAAN